MKDLVRLLLIEQRTLTTHFSKYGQQIWDEHRPAMPSTRNHFWNNFSLLIYCISIHNSCYCTLIQFKFCCEIKEKINPSIFRILYPKVWKITAKVSFVMSLKWQQTASRKSVIIQQKYSFCHCYISWDLQGNPAAIRIRHRWHCVAPNGCNECDLSLISI
jgi:hypothetical protein